MGKDKIRHLVKTASGFYFQPSKSMKAAGYRAEPLGKDPVAAAARVIALNDAWDAERSGRKEVAPALNAPGTMGRFIHDLKGTRAYLDKSLARQDELDYTTAIIARVFGPTQMRAITPEHCEKFYDGLRLTGSEHRAARVMKDFRFLFNRALKFRAVSYNPALAFAVKQPESRTQKWTDAQVNLAINTAWSNGYKGAAVALAIAYDTGLSPVDIRTLTMGQIDGNKLVDTSRAKTGNQVMGELWPETLAWIAAYHADLDIESMPNALVIRTRRGRPYTKDILAKDIRKVRALAGLPAALQLRDMRRTATIEELEGGATEKQVAAARGWSAKTASRMSDVYGPNSFAMAKGAHDRRPKNLKGPKV